MTRICIEHEEGRIGIDLAEADPAQLVRLMTHGMDIVRALSAGSLSGDATARVIARFVQVGRWDYDAGEVG